MAPSTLLASTAEPARVHQTDEVLNLPALRRFYAWNAPLYDWTRPFILFGRRHLLDQLALPPKARVLDVGCGTGWMLLRLRERGMDARGVDCSPAMLAQARAKLERRGFDPGPGMLEERPYGSHDGYRGSLDAIVFSYSLSMMPPYGEVLAAAVDDLRPGGQIAVVDFLGSQHSLVSAWLGANHVRLGDERLRELTRLLPKHRVSVRRGALWSYYLFWGRRTP